MRHIETSVSAQLCDRKMETREIKSDVGRRTYFDAVSQDISIDEDDGNREMGDLYPFLICGGQNTERYWIFASSVFSPLYAREPKEGSRFIAQNIIRSRGICIPFHTQRRIRNGIWRK